MRPASVRLGIRGFASGNTTPPSLAEGERTIDLGTLTRTHAATQTDGVDGAALATELGEKRNRVEFFADGARRPPVGRARHFDGSACGVRAMPGRGRVGSASSRAGTIAAKDAGEGGRREPSRRIAPHGGAPR